MGEEIFTTGKLFPGTELVLQVGNLDGLGWFLDGGGGSDFLEGGNLGRDLLERGEFLLLQTDIQGVSSDDDEGLEVNVGARGTSKVDKDGRSGVQWVGVVQLEGGVSHVESSDAVTSGQVDVLNDEDESLIGSAELSGLGGDVHLTGKFGQLVFELFGRRGS